MGLTRYSRPVANGFYTGDFTVVGGGAAWDAINDEWRSATNIARGVTGGVETDPTNDSVYITATPAAGRSAFASFFVTPVAGDDDLRAPTFWFRLRTTAGARTLHPFIRSGSVDYYLPAVSYTATGAFQNVSTTPTLDPRTTHAVYRPTGAGAETAWDTLVGAATHHAAVGEAVPDNTTAYIAAAGVAIQRDFFTVTATTAATQAPSRLIFHMRFSHGIDDTAAGVGLAGWTRTASPVYRTPAGVIYAIASNTIVSTGLDPLLWLDYVGVASTNPDTGVAWTVADIANGQFGVSASADLVTPIGISCTHFYITADGGLSGLPWDVATLGLTNTWTPGTTDARGIELGLRVAAGEPAFDLSRVYVEWPFAVGPTLGRDKRGENWRWCDVCARKTPYSQTVRPVPPHPQAGLVVCHLCHDRPDHDTLKVMSHRVPRDRQDPLY